MASIFDKQQEGTIKLAITIPLNDVKKAQDEVIEAAVKNANVAGFRQGKAPRKLVEENLDKEKIREEVLKKLLPLFYVESVRQHNLKPIINPKIHVDELEEGKDWKFTAITCEAPSIDLKDYKENIKKLTAAATFDVAKDKIIVPGKEEKKTNFDEIVAALLDSISVTVPTILLDLEVERLLAQTLDEIKSLGLTLESYLQSTGKNIISLKAEYAKKAEGDIKLEFALQKVAEKEHITVEEKEVSEAIQKAKDDKERQSLEGNRYLLASILRQQKTLDFLKNL